MITVKIEEPAENSVVLWKGAKCLIQLALHVLPATQCHFMFYLNSRPVNEPDKFMSVLLQHLGLIGLPGLGLGFMGAPDRPRSRPLSETGNGRTRGA